MTFPIDVRFVMKRLTLSANFVDDLQSYPCRQLARLNRGHDLPTAIKYMLKHCVALTLSIADGRVCLSKNAMERGLRGIVLGRN